MQTHHTFKLKTSSKNPNRKVMVLNLKKELSSYKKTNLKNNLGEKEMVSHLFHRDINSKQANCEDEGNICGNSSFLNVPMKDCLRLIENYSIEMVRGKGKAEINVASSILKTIFERMFRKENYKIKKNMSNFTKANLEFKMVVESLKEFKQRKMEGDKPIMKPGAGFQKNIRDIEFYAQNHFPLCMYDMFRTLKRERHLKHNGRLQLILFIKGLGFKVEEVIQFFKEIVSKGPAAKKIKEYEYMVKHSYGLVGSKTEYSGMGCPKIMSNSRPSKGDVHGCPFNYYGEDSLFNLVVHKLGNAKDAQEVVKANSMGAKFGCRKFFCSKNKLLDIEDVDEGIGRHPNIYFNVSYYRKGRKREFKPKNNDEPKIIKSKKIMIEAGGD